MDNSSPSTEQSDERLREVPVVQAPVRSQGEASKVVRPVQEKRLYPVIWRWHFYAGLFVAPLFLIVTLTGAIYVFRTELTAIRDRSLHLVEPQSQRLSYEELRTIAAKAAAPHEIGGIQFWQEANRSVAFEAHIEPEGGGGGDHRHLHQLIYLNPYTGEVLGSRVAEDDFFAIVLQLHRNLLLGSTGRWVIELSTSWGMLLLATGLYLWWPRGKKNVGVWIPRLRGKLYPVLRDLHSVTGFYLLPLAVILIGTGMFFTPMWGNTFNTTVKAAGHWAPKWFGEAKSAKHGESAKSASLDQVVATALTHARPFDSGHMDFELKPDGAYKAWLIQDEDKNSYRMVSIDQFTAETIERVDAQDVPLLYRVRLLAVSTHMGQIFGVTTKILTFLTSVVLLGLVITGVWMWWKRRPTGRSGFPQRPAAGSLPVWGWGLIVCCGIVLPVAGISILLITLIDWLWVLVRGRKNSLADGASR